MTKFDAVTQPVNLADPRIAIRAHVPFLSQERGRTGLPLGCSRRLGRAYSYLSQLRLGFERFADGANPLKSGIQICVLQGDPDAVRSGHPDIFL